MDQLRQHVTPVILTYNEEANLDRCLSALTWAREVVVVDSGSTDATQAIARRYPNSSLLIHPFESFGSQWRFALESGNIKTDFVLALDADMTATAELQRELETSGVLDGGYNAALIPFKMSLWGAPLRGTLYPPDIRLFRRSAVQIGDRGQHHSFQVPDPVFRCTHHLIHDDRKSFDRWLHNQQKYSQIEASRIIAGGASSLKDRLRASGLMPPVMCLYAYTRAGGPLAGKAALRYAYERLVAESLKSMRILEHTLDMQSKSRKD